MNNGLNNQIKLGIFVSLGVFLLIISIYFIGSRQHLFSRTILISGIFTDVSGLQVGNNVRFSGTNIGTIDNIEINSDSSIKVDMIIEKKVQKYIKKNAIAMIGSEGLMGNKVVNLSSGDASSGPIKNFDIVKTFASPTIDGMMSSLKVSIDNAAVITNDIAILTAQLTNGNGTIGKLFMDSSFANNLDIVLENTKEASKGLNQNMKAVQNNILLKGYFKKKEKEAAKLKK